MLLTVFCFVLFYFVLQAQTSTNKTTASTSSFSLVTFHGLASSEEHRKKNHHPLNEKTRRHSGSMVQESMYTPCRIDFWTKSIIVLRADSVEIGEFSSNIT